MPGDTNAARDLFLRDTVAGTTTRVGLDINYREIAGGIEDADISRNGDFIVFTTLTNLLPSDGNTDTVDTYRIQLR